MSNASTYLSSGAAIKSIQRGSLTASALSHAITISAVDVSQCVLTVETCAQALYLSGSYYSVSGDLVLTNSTTLTYSQSYPAASMLAWTLVEYAGAVKSRQFVTLNDSGNPSGTVAITAVVPAKTIITYNGAQIAYRPSGQVRTGYGQAWLASASTVGWVVDTGETMINNRFQITEFN